MTFYLRTPAGVHYRLETVEHYWADPVDNEGRPCRVVDGGYRSTNKPLFVVADDVVDSITFSRITPGPITGYELTDPTTESVRWPLRLSVEAWGALDDDSQDLYRVTRDPGEVVTLTVEVAGHQPWPIDAARDRIALPEGARWVPSTQWMDAFGFVAHDHLIPGALVGFHGAVAAHLRSHPNYSDGGGLVRSDIRFDRNGTANPWADVSFRFTHEDGLTERVKGDRRRLNRAAFQTVRVRITPGQDAVYGEDMEDAIERWNSRLAAVMGQVPRPSVVCSHCRGVGFIEREMRNGR